MGQFQSLFSWILLSEEFFAFLNYDSCLVSILVFLDLALRVQLRAISIIWLTCFNPCFLGSCSPSLGNILIDELKNLFQSLFSWILLSECTIEDLDHRQILFQSLFSWILLSEEDLRKAISFLNRFQSLFSWILLSESKRPKLPDEYNWFQSLFSWILLSEQAGSRSPQEFLWGFNPCFLGSCSPSVPNEKAGA